MDRPPSLPRWRTTLALVLVAVALGGCGLIPPEYPPKLISSRAGAGRFPPNSRAAIRAAAAAEVWGIEVDVVLTKDEVAVLSEETWINPERCTRADGSELPADEKVRIMDLTYDALVSGYLCGGKEDPETPDARLVADTYVTLSEFYRLSAGIHTLLLDIKQGPDTLDAETYARVILDVFDPRRAFIASSNPEALRTFNAFRPEVTMLLVWPLTPADAGTIGNEVTRVLGFQDLVNRIEDAEANGIAVDYRVADRTALEVVRQSGYLTALWTPNSEASLRVFCDWPVNYILTDSPERASCHWFSR